MKLSILHAVTLLRRRRILKILLLMRRRTQIRTRNTLENSGVVLPIESHWTNFYAYATDSDFIAQTGICRDSFEHLLLVFNRYYWLRESPQTVGGRPRRLIHNHSALGDNHNISYLSNKKHRMHIDLLSRDNGIQRTLFVVWCWSGCNKQSHSTGRACSLICFKSN